MDIRQLKAFNEKSMVKNIVLKPWSKSPEDGWVVEAMLISEEAVLVKKMRSEATKIYKSVDGAYGDLLSVGCSDVTWQLK